MIRTHAIVGVILFLGNCASKTTVSTNQETIIVAQSNSPFTIDSTSGFYQVLITPKKHLQFSTKNKLQLLFKGVRVIENPEGVLEVYLSGQSAKMNELQSERKDFVNVLDLYSLETSTNKTITIDLTATFNNLFKDKELYSPLYISVLFRGNKFQNGEESKKTGKVSFDGFRIIQSNK